METTSCEWYDIPCGIGWLANELYLIWLKIWLEFFGWCFSLIELIPVPAFLLNLPTIQVYPGIAWGADLISLDFGITVFITSYLIRFSIRRIPIIG